MSDSEEEIRRLLQSAKVDQGEAGGAAIGRVAGALYYSLRVYLSEQLASTLVRDWFYLQMHKATYPNIAPQPPLWDMQMPEGDDK